MAIIDPDGLFYGTRLGECSDPAQLFWPRFLLASNGFGRIRIDYDELLRGPLKSLKKPPTRKQVLEMFREYREHFLAFPYVSNGELWAQWDVAPRLLSKYQTAADRRSPAPPERELQQWKAAYAELKRSRSVDLLDYEVIFTTSIKPTISENFQTTSGVAEPSPTTSVGVGVGVGIGKGDGEVKNKTLSPKPTATDERFAPFIDAIDRYWKFKNPEQPFVWDASEGKALKTLLAAAPHLTLDQFRMCLKHRARSDVVQTERPRMWLANVMNFAAGPLDRYAKPLQGNGNGTQRTSAAASRHADIVETTARALGLVADRPPGWDAEAEPDGVVTLEGRACALPGGGRGGGDS